MLYKLKIKEVLSVKKLAALLLALPLSLNTYAQESNRDIQIHGFIAQGIIKASGSDFVNDDQATSAELTEVGINASYQISDSLRLAGQAVYINGGNRYAEGGRVDYLLLDWSAYQTLDSQLNFYFGRFKNYHWLYSSTRDVPFTRPSIVLPQSIYFDGFRDIAVGGDGIAMSFKHTQKQLGDFDINLSYGTSNISNKQKTIILSRYATGNMKHERDIQGSIYWRPQNAQWRFGLAGLNADFSYRTGKNDQFTNAEIKLERLKINALYEGERWEFSSEAFQERFILNQFYSPTFKQNNLGQGFFVQSQFQATQNIKLLARFERFYADKNDKNGKKREQATNGQFPARFGFQHDITVGLTYTPVPNIQLQVEHHWVEGTARLTPVVLPNILLNKDKNWQMSAIQLVYWF